MEQTKKRLKHNLIPGKKHGMPHKKGGMCEVDEPMLSDMFDEFTSSLYVLAVKLKGFHWNIVGDQFFPIHILLDQQVDDLLDFADQSAELIRQIDNSPAPVGMRAMVLNSFIKETTTADLVSAEKILPIIVKDYVTMVTFSQRVITHADANNRQDLSDFAISVIQYLNKYKWQFESAIK